MQGHLFIVGSDITADNILNTSFPSGQGVASSYSASSLGELGLNFSHSKASATTRIVGVTGSVGLSLTPGPNYYLGSYTSKILFKK